MDIADAGKSSFITMLFCLELQRLHYVLKLSNCAHYTDFMGEKWVLYKNQTVLVE